MLALALVFAGLAALVHVYIFVLESLRWEQPATRAVFGTDEQTAAITKQLAYNQGFYNLFLALGTAAGIGLCIAQHRGALILVAFCTASMVLAALVLVTADSSKSRAAIVQGLLPLICLLDLAIRWLTR